MNSSYIDEHKYKTWAEIDLSALRHNFRQISRFVKSKTPRCRVICVVKADAYGHGAPECSRALYEEGCDFFAVSSIGEAAELREAMADFAPDILILGYTPPENADILIRYGITQTVFSPEYAQKLDESICRYKQSGIISDSERLTVHIKVDSGMNRLGFDSSSQDCAEEIARAISYKSIKSRGIFTHFSSADEIPGRGEEICRRQYENFQAVRDSLKSRGINFECVHVCNSAAIVNCPDLHLDAVRAGVMLYGLPPSSEHSDKTSGFLDLKPVMKLRSVISHIHTVHKGDSISYGGDYTADREMTVATIPIGYADGFTRVLSNGGGGMIDGHFAPILGRICMDQCVLDITGINAKTGCPVTFFGDTPDQIEKLAKIANTINYELVCLVNKRVKRLYSENTAGDTF